MSPSIVPTASARSALPSTLDELIPPDLAARLDRLDLLSRKILAGKLPGERRSKRRGRSVEFDDFRDYVPGDDLRHIDWNIYARLDRLFIKLFREEEDLALHLVVDCTPSMASGEPSKAAFAARLAMALGYIGLVNQNRVTMSVFGGGDDRTGVRVLAPMRGRRSVQRLGAFLLEALRAQSRRGPVTGMEPAALFTAAMRRIAESRRAGGNGVMVVLSDFLVPGSCGEGLTFVGGASAGVGFDAYALQVLSPGEIDPGKEHEAAAGGGSGGLLGDLRLTDVETGGAVEVTVTPTAIARYRDALRRHIDRLRADCLSRGVAHFLISTDTSVADLVLNTLRRGGMLR